MRSENEVQEEEEQEKGIARGHYKKSVKRGNTHPERVKAVCRFVKTRLAGFFRWHINASSLLEKHMCELST